MVKFGAPKLEEDQEEKEVKQKSKKKQLKPTISPKIPQASTPSPEYGRFRC